MQFTAACMGIMDGIKVVFLQYLIELPDIFWQVVYINSSVFNYRNGFFIARHVAKQTQSSFTECPYFFGIISKQQRKMIPELSTAHFLFNMLRNFHNFLTRILCKFNNENCSRIALHKKTILALFDIVFCTF